MRENLSSGFPTRSDTNPAAQQQKMFECLKFRIKKVEGVYYLCSENKGTDQLRGHPSAFVLHMQRAGFLITRLIYRWCFVVVCFICAIFRGVFIELITSVGKERADYSAIEYL